MILQFSLRFPSLLSALLVLMLVTQTSQAQRKKSKDADVSLTYDTALYNGLTWRSIGPYRGGRASSVTGVPGKPQLYYFGATGGGVWRTMDGGSTWENISDGFFGGSIGAVAVSESDPNVIYVGQGEQTVRGNVSSGFGIWKSVDAGKNWQHIGLEGTRHIGRIRVHPNNSDIVYVAAMGDLYQSSDERGVYKSTDGGKTWERKLFANADAGAVDMILDPANPRIMYASTWNIRRTPYSLSSGGPGSALWKSTDEGETWKEISKNKGMPEGTLGIIGVAVSPVNSERVYAMIEAEEGGLFRSEDGGVTWKKVNEDRNLRQRAWYYTRIYADPKEEDGVYVLNVSYHHSKDGGESFESNNAPHGDHHDLWIAPEDPSRMIMADDGGAQVSTDGGMNWTTYHNQPTAQFYRVVTDNHFPYRIYGAQQDNSTVRIAHRSEGYSITEDDWEETAGAESAHLAPDPENPDIVYGGNYGGFLSRVNHSNGQERVINVWPDNPMGHGAEDMKYRFQWNFPIMFSPHDPNKMYTTSNHVHYTTNEGQSWETISPDLTRNDSTKLVSSGGPITQDNTSVEYYGTIFAVNESPVKAGVIWTGSDDGLVYVTQDNGENWTNVTPEGMPTWLMINSIDPHPTEAGGAYIAGTLYKGGDFKPYLYKTTNYGQTWTKITNGIPDTHFTRVVRADPKREGLLYAGTEYGMYVSFNDGDSWQPFQMNLPIVPITDLAIKNDNLIAATQGRSFWLIDDITPLHQLSDSVVASNFHLFKPIDTYKMPGGTSYRGSEMTSLTEGTNHPGGVMLHYYMKEKPDTATTVKLEIMDQQGKLIRSYATDAKEDDEKLEVAQGLNRFVWDMQYPEASDFKGMILWGGGTQGPEAVPGTYTAKLTMNDESQETEFVILKDPRIKATQEDLQAQFDFLMEVRDKLTETHDAITDIRALRAQMKMISDNLKGQENTEEVIEKTKSIDEKITKIEQTLYQTKNESRQDPLNFPIRLNNKLANLASQVGRGSFRPTNQANEFKEEVTKEIDEQLSLFRQVQQQDVPELNQMVKDVDLISVSSKEAPDTVN
uniref:Glycosyl hydrolase n=1 Tax=Roseihalotalea indica TaxID=2867963 RepID=A0AA49GNC9_9BACT|nr:glycosyl hydrolase [Tunicatimonas sp. TK19036]